MKTIYNYHPQYGYFMASSEADESPLEPGVYLIPGYATEIAPPEDVAKDRIAIFDPESNEWFVTKDYRGTYYSKYEPWSEKIDNHDPQFRPDMKDYALGPIPETKYMQDVFFNEDTQAWEIVDTLTDDREPDERIAFVREFVNQLDLMGISIDELKDLLDRL
jgi:hypothetical protein